MRRKAALALALAVDGLQFLITPLIPIYGIGLIIDAVLDVTVAIVLTLFFGFHWIYLPSFIAELIPGVDLMPVWTGAVLLTWNTQPKIPESANPPETGQKNVPDKPKLVGPNAEKYRQE